MGGHRIGPLLCQVELRELDQDRTPPAGHGPGVLLSRRRGDRSQKLDGGLLRVLLVRARRRRDELRRVGVAPERLAAGLAGLVGVQNNDVDENFSHDRSLPVG